MAKNTQLMFSGMQADAALIVPGNFANRLLNEKSLFRTFLDWTGLQLIAIRYNLGFTVFPIDLDF